MPPRAGVLVLQIWRDEACKIRARVSTKIDIAASSDPAVAYYQSTDDLEAAVGAWVNLYSAVTKPGQNGV
jgi:hypothetical protein